jgi:transcription elongation factor
MKPSHEQHNDFFAHKLLPGVVFEHNDAVEVIGGEYAGDSGSIVSVEQLGDNPVYLVELDSRQDAVIVQSLLRLVEA